MFEQGCGQASQGYGYAVSLQSLPARTCQPNMAALQSIYEGSIVSSGVFPPFMQQSVPPGDGAAAAQIFGMQPVSMDDSWVGYTASLASAAAAPCPVP